MQGRLSRPAVFYLFLPPGSRKISDLTQLCQYPIDLVPLLPNIICHDQEPLCWDQYTDQQSTMQDHRDYINTCFKAETGVHDWLQLHDLNLDQGICNYSGISIYDQTVVLHSEINSANLQRYQDAGFFTSYWLSHAMISRDWYRFAQHDSRLKPGTHFQPFLIYSRGFTGSREYRPKFLEYLCQYALVPLSRISCLHHENDQDIFRLQPSNSVWRLDSPHRLLQLPQCKVESTASADYNAEDIASTACQIVLETQFDSSCLHLTEKTFRPLATGQPFMLLAGTGALALLRRYGFETYHGFIDESYDLIFDSHDRMRAVLREMQRLSTMNSDAWTRWRSATQAIAARNQKRFFSSEFANMVWDECFNNLENALDQSIRTRGRRWLEQRRRLRTNQPINWKSYLGRDNERAKGARLRQLRQGR